jgi:hypothetical protein
MIGIFIPSGSAKRIAEPNIRPVDTVTATPRDIASLIALQLRSGILPALSSSVPSRSEAINFTDAIFYISS